MSINRTMIQAHNNGDNDDIFDGCDDSHEQLVSLETAALEAALADGVIANGSDIKDGKHKKAGLRRGKWTVEEENYANRLISEFKLGLLPLTDGTTLRTFLSKLLNCDPMRISKKFVGGKCIGKQVFRRRQADLERLSPDEIEASRNELADLERQFLERVAQMNRIKVTGANNTKVIKTEGVKLTSGFDDHHTWSLPPSLIQPNNFVAHSSASSSSSSDGASYPFVQQNNLYAYAHQQMNGKSGELCQSESAADMQEFQRLMASSSGALAGLNSEQQQLAAYQSSQVQQPYQNQFNAYPRVSTLEVLCGEAEEPSGGEGGTRPFPEAPFRTNSFPWGLNSPTLSGRHSYPVDDSLGGGGDDHLNAVNRNYYAQGGGQDGAGMRYSSSAEWPSMNNLVVAAETIEHLGSMNSLLGGGLLGSMNSMGALTAAMGNSSQSGLQPIIIDSRPGSSGGGNDFVSYYRDSRLTPPVSMDGATSSGDHLAELNSSSAMRQDDQLQGDSNVGYPLDDEEEDGEQLRPVGGLMHSNGNGSDTPTGAILLSMSDGERGTSPRDRAMSVCSDRGAGPIASTTVNGLHAHGDQPQGSFARKEAASTHSEGFAPSSRRTAVSAVHPLAKTSSVDNFWMLVDMGDLPQPDSDVLSMTLWGQGGSSNKEGPSSTDRAQQSGDKEGAAKYSPQPDQQSDSSTRSDSRQTMRISPGRASVSTTNNIGSPRITPDLLPPHLSVNHGLLAKHPRDSSLIESANGFSAAATRSTSSNSTDSMHVSDAASVTVEPSEKEQLLEEEHDVKRTRLFEVDEKPLR